ncbi:hypothetical protein Trydic_g3926 [Trypoxylus dichotomus]
MSCGGVQLMTHITIAALNFRIRRQLPPGHMSDPSTAGRCDATGAHKPHVARARRLIYYCVYCWRPSVCRTKSPTARPYVMYANSSRKQRPDINRRAAIRTFPTICWKLDRRRQTRKR